MKDVLKLINSICGYAEELESLSICELCTNESKEYQEKVRLDLIDDAVWELLDIVSALTVKCEEARDQLNFYK